MKIEAVYDNGRIKLPPFLRLASERFPVRIEIPESEIISEPAHRDTGLAPSYVLPPEAKALAKEVSERLDRIRDLVPTEEEMPNLTQKQKDEQSFDSSVN